jgi:hypothetical protein
MPNGQTRSIESASALPVQEIREFSGPGAPHQGKSSRLRQTGGTAFRRGFPASAGTMQGFPQSGPETSWKQNASTPSPII